MQFFFKLIKVAQLFLITNIITLLNLKGKLYLYQFMQREIIFMGYLERFTFFFMQSFF